MFISTVKLDKLSLGPMGIDSLSLFAVQIKEILILILKPDSGGHLKNCRFCEENVTLAVLGS